MSIMEKIQAAYTREQSLNLAPVTADDLPLSYESITAGWLTAVLCARAPGAEVERFTLGPTDNGSSNRRRIHITYNQAGRDAGLPTALFCKASHSLQNRIMLGVSGGADCEAMFYNSIRPLLDIEAPVGYFAKSDPETFNSIIMLGDITDEVMEFCSDKTVMTRARAESQMRLLGKMHGATAKNPVLRERVKAFKTFKQFFEDTQRFGLDKGAIAGFAAAENVIPPRLFARQAEIWPATLEAVEALDRLPRGLAHGDVHLKNWYVAGNGEMALGDWQCCGYSHGGRDVAYAVATALTVENRRAWERELVAYYLEELQSAGGPRTEFDSFWNIYRQQMTSALAWWTVTLCPPPGTPDMQPRDITVEFIRRIATAMDDLDSL